MAIQAIGARSQMMLPPAQQTRESANSQDVQAGSIQVAPETGKSSTQDFGAGEGTLGSPNGQTRVQQFLSMFEESVTEQIKTGREENQINELLTSDEVDQAKQTFEQDIQAIREGVTAESDSEPDIGFVSSGVLDAINKLARSLKFSIDGMLPSVPPQTFHAEYPPEPELNTGGPQTPDEILRQGLDELV